MQRPELTPEERALATFAWFTCLCMAGILYLFFAAVVILVAILGVE